MNTPNPGDPFVGTVVSGTYRILKPLAEGGMGSVYLAEHVRFHRKFAVKFLSGDLTRHREMQIRFQREAEIAGRLSHPNIVEVTDFNITEAGTPYIVMEFLQGEDLASLLERRGRIPPGEVVYILRGVAEALDVAHAAGVVHRDLKPQNIFLARKGSLVIPKILDFGISKIQEDIGAGLTRTNTIMGTPNYMSPEQASGKVHEIDGRTDVFALGCIAYELLTGAAAFPGETPPAVIHAICYEQPIPPRDIVPELPPQVEPVLFKALAKDKEWRYARAREFVEDLAKALEGHEPVTQAAAASSHQATSSAPASPMLTGPVGAPQEARTPASDRLAETPARSATPRDRPASHPESGPVADVTEPMDLPELGPRKRRSYALGIVAGLLLLAAAGGAAAWFMSGNTEPKTNTAPEPKPRPAEPARPARPAKKLVTLRFLVTPSDAKPTVYVNGQPQKQTVIRVPRSEGVLNIKVIAPGYQTYELAVAPLADNVFSVPLTKIQAATSPAQADRRHRGRRRRRRPRQTDTRPVARQVEPSRASPAPRTKPRPRPRNLGVYQARPDGI